MLAHSFDRFYVITKFILPTLDELKLYPIEYDKEYWYLRKSDDEDDDRIKQNIRLILLLHKNKTIHVSLYNADYST